MIQIDSEREKRILTTTQSGGYGAPVFSVRNASGAFGFWQLHNSTVVPNYKFIEWAAGQPDGTPGTHDCLWVYEVNSQFYDDSCTGANFGEQVCEMDRYDFAGTLAWTLSPTAFSSHANMNYLTPIDASKLPTTTTDVIYGATVHIAVHECHEFDRSHRCP